jgi:histidine triad (HIT) family protein
MVVASGDSECIFCSIVAGDAPATRIHEDERTLAFMDINPATWGHALVVPKTHSVDLLDIEPGDLAACTSAAQHIATRAIEGLGADGVNLLQCSGAAAWQTVFHFHLHVVPRHANDSARDALQLPWIPTPGEPDAIAAAAARMGRHSRDLG